MAYNRTFNPDALPAFAEPERKNSPLQKPTPPLPTQNFPPRNSSAQGPPPPQQDPHYSKRPPPQGHAPQQIPQAQQGYSAHPHQGLPIRPDNNNLRSSHDGHRQPSPVMQPVGNYAYASSPPGNQNGRFPPPQQQQQQQQQPQRPTQASPRQLPPAGSGGAASDPSLLPLFRAVDKNGSGQLSEKELGAALVNGDWTAFDPHTVTLMIRMFDSDRSGTIGFEEFCGLWSFLAAWRTLFDRFDTDRSGNISLEEFNNALFAFGYTLSPGFVEYLFNAYDKAGKRSLSFDLFVQSCISLKRMTDSFKKYDDERRGFITLQFEQFLTEILKQR